MMAAETNGRPVYPNKVKGLPNGMGNGHVVGQRPGPKPQSPTILGTSFSWITRLLVWYTVITALFRCPSSFSELRDDSPKICKPYLNARSFFAPYVEPYYLTYGAPHVERARPYVHTFNKHVYAPTYHFGKDNYEKYGAPRVDQARTYGQEQWGRILKPQIDSAQAQAKEQYNLNLAPYISKASAASLPYYTASRDTLLQIYNTHMLPAYEASRPYVENAYNSGHRFATETALPYAQTSCASIVTLFDRTLWPRMRILYGENVEPQLVRIGERLGRYRDGKKLKAVMENINNFSQSSSMSSSISSVAASVAPAPTSSPIETPAASATPTLTPEQEAKQTREKIESDLKNWQEKFAKAADKGEEDLAQRAKEITDRQIESQVHGVGEALVIQLEESIRSEVAKLKKAILSTVSSLGEELTESKISTAKDDLAKATRSAGLAVKDKAQALRSWKENYDQETQALVSAASESTLEVIDNIRDLGLQEIGMRWAWMEDVTYQDWSKYHEVKKTFEDWRQAIQAVAHRHGGLKESRDASDELESNGMAKAEAAAKELGRLKEIGKWKIEAGDASDDWNTKYVPAGAAAASQKETKKASSGIERIVGTSQGTLESIVSEATQRASDAAPDASRKMIGTEPGVAEQATSKINEAVSMASEKASEAITGTQTPASEGIISASIDKAKANQMASDASEAIIGTQAPAYDSVASESSKSADSAASALLETVSRPSTFGMDNITGGDKSISSSTSSVEPEASKNKVPGGAMAQNVRDQKPIMDDIVSDNDDSTYSEKMQNIVHQAGGRYADITKAVSEALGKATSTQGTVESASSVANEQYSKALAAASSVLYGTKQGSAESVTSVASEKWAEAVAAASTVIYGTPAPVTQTAVSAAQSAYSHASILAQEQYSQAISSVSALISGESTPAHEKMLSSVEQAYSDSVAAASERIQAVMNTVSGGTYGTASSPQESVIFAANAKYSDAMAAASSQLESAKSAMGATSTPGYEKFMSEASHRYSSVMGAASVHHASATRAASEAIYGPSQGVLDSISALASSKLADSLNAASAQYSSIMTAVGATPTPLHQQYVMEGQRRYYEAVGLAHERYSKFLIGASSAVYGTPTAAYQSLASAASESFYGTPPPSYQSMLNAAQAQYSDAVTHASQKLQSVMGSASSAVGKKEKSPAQSVLDSASSQYNSALSLASASLSSVSAAASTGIYGVSTGKVEFMASALSEKAGSISSAAFTAVAGSETPWTESMASQASENWEVLVSKASEQVYGAPTPFSQSVMSQAGDYAAQATGAAVAQYEAVQALFSELVNGKEPDYTESVMQKLSSAFYTGAHANVAASASSYASDGYASASSAVSSIFTPPATIETIIAAAHEQVNAAVEAVSNQYYGTSKGNFEKGTSAAASAASSASSRVSEAVYGTEAGYIESAQASLSAAAVSAQDAISAALYGTTATGATASISSAAGNAYSSVSSVVAENAEAASSAMDATQSRIREAVYGPEQGAYESAQSKLMVAVQSAKAKIAEFAPGAAEGSSSASSAAAKASEIAEHGFSSASSVSAKELSSASSAAAKVSKNAKQEL